MACSSTDTAKSIISMRRLLQSQAKGRIRQQKMNEEELEEATKADTYTRIANKQFVRRWDNAMQKGLNQGLWHFHSGPLAAQPLPVTWTRSYIQQPDPFDTDLMLNRCVITDTTSGKRWYEAPHEHIKF